MTRILAIDYGMKRCGIAISDPLKIIANAYGMIYTINIFSELKKIISEKNIDTIIVGYPLTLKGTISDTTQMVHQFIQNLQNEFPEIIVIKIDERLTSKMAQQTLIFAQAKKKERQKKENTDIIAATILLQYYLDYYYNKK